MFRMASFVGVNALFTTLAKAVDEVSGGASQMKQALLNLTTNDAVFTTFADKKNPMFAEAWPESLPDTVLETDEFVAVVTAVRKADPRLQKRCDKLVPKKVDELTFWRSYLGHAHLVLIAMHDPEHRRRAFLSTLPPPRPDAERRFPKADGDLSFVRAVRSP